MLKINNLQGFWRGNGVASSASPIGLSPVIPTNAWTFDDPYSPLSDSIGYRDITGQGGEWSSGYPSKRGLSIGMAAVGAYLSVGVDGSPISLTGWFLPSTATDVDIFKLSNPDGTFVRIEINYTTSTTYSIWLEWYDGTAGIQQVEISTGHTIGEWIFFGLFFRNTGTKAVTAVINDNTYSYSNDLPDSRMTTLSFNSELTASNSTTHRDEIYFWEGVELSESNFLWLYNQGVGNYVKGSGDSAFW